MEGTAFAAPAPAEMAAAFAFRVAFLGLPKEGQPVIASFKEVSGLESAMETEDVADGGENRFVHQLPTQPKGRRLHLKRGLVERNSAFVKWCRQSLDYGLAAGLQPINVQVWLIDGDLQPLIKWTCVQAYPVRWAVQAFESQTNEVALEEIELAYQTLENR